MWLAIFGFALFRRVGAAARRRWASSSASSASRSSPGRVGDAGASIPPASLALLVSPVLLDARHALRGAARGAAGPALLASGIQMPAAGVALRRDRRADRRVGGVRPGAPCPRRAGRASHTCRHGQPRRLHDVRLAITVAPLSRVSTYAYVNPVVAVILGWLVLLGAAHAAHDRRLGRDRGRRRAHRHRQEPAHEGRGPGGTRHDAQRLAGRRGPAPRIRPLPSRRPRRHASPRPDADPVRRAEARPQRGAPVPARHPRPLRRGAASLLVRHGGSAPIARRWAGD